jgi:hypothetical protein
MFRNNLNSSLPEINSSTTISTLNYIKRILTQQRENYINLLNENRRMIDSINTHIDEYEIQTTTINPQQNVRSQLFSTNNHVLSNDEILRYTTAIRYSEIQEPLNIRCHLSGLRFMDDNYVCRLPCGHLFDGPSICYHLTHVNSSCPMCNQNLITEYQSQQQPTTTPLSRRQNTNTQTFQTPIINRNNLSNSINNYFSNEFVELFTTILSSELTTSSNLLTEEEIQNATETICYEDIENPISERCPISYIEFENDTNVSRIKNCNHIFDPNSLTEWLTRQNTCPVCRYNLKSHSTTNDNLNSNVAGSISSYDVSGNRIYSRNGYTTHYYFTR